MQRPAGIHFGGPFSFLATLSANTTQKLQYPRPSVVKMAHSGKHSMIAPVELFALLFEPMIIMRNEGTIFSLPRERSQGAQFGSRNGSNVGRLTPLKW